MAYETERGTLESYKKQLIMVNGAISSKPKWIARKQFLEAEIDRLSRLLNVKEGE